MTELRKRGGGGDPDSTENISDKVRILHFNSDSGLNIGLVGDKAEQLHSVQERLHHLVLLCARLG